MDQRAQLELEVRSAQAAAGAEWVAAWVAAWAAALGMVLEGP